MTMNTFAPSSLVRASLMIPVVVAGLWLLRAPESAQRLAVAFAPAEAEGMQPMAGVEDTNEVSAPESPIEMRRARITQLLDRLDQIASVTQQMAPERAATIEPVLVDLAERTLDLSEAKNVKMATTDASLTKLEGTVDQLVRSLNKAVAPEISL